MNRSVLKKASKIALKHYEPSRDDIKVMPALVTLTTDRQSWGRPPFTFHEFAETLQREIIQMELRWLV